LIDLMPFAFCAGIDQDFRKGGRMTAPDTNVKKQAKRHVGPLIGIAFAVGVALVLLIWFMGRTVSDVPETEQPTPAAVEETQGIPADGTVAGPGDTGAPQAEEVPPQPAD